MGFGSILGGIAGAVLGGPAGASIGATLGGAAEGAVKGPAKAENAANYSYIPSGVSGTGLQGFNTIDMPGYPTLPGYQDMPSLPSSIATLPAQYLPATAGEQKMSGAIDASQILTLAALNPNHPIIRQLAKQNEQGANRDFARTLRDMMVQSQRQQARGRTGYFNPERGDGDILTSIMNQAANNRIGAGAMAQQQALQGAGNFRDIANSYSSLAGQQTGRRNTFLEMLAQQIGQQRADTQSRTQTAQDNSLNRQNQVRNDILALFQNKNQNAINAINTANKAGASSMANVQDYQARKAGANSANTAALSSLLGSPELASLFGGGGSSNFGNRGFAWAG